MGGMFSAPKPMPAPPPPKIEDRSVQDEANKERIRRQRSQGRSSTILTDNATVTPSDAIAKKTLLGG